MFTVRLRISRAHILICLYMNPWQSTFFPYTLLGVQPVPSLLLPYLVAAFHKPKLYYRLAGLSRAMLSHWKEPSDSNFTVPSIRVHLPLSMPKEPSSWQRVCNCTSVLAPHGILHCCPLLQRQVLLQSNGMAGTSNLRVLIGELTAQELFWVWLFPESTDVFLSLYVCFPAICNFRPFAISHLVLKNQGVQQITSCK